MGNIKEEYKVPSRQNNIDELLKQAQARQEKAIEQIKRDQEMAGTSHVGPSATREDEER